MRIEPCAKGVDFVVHPYMHILLYILYRYTHECIMKKDFVDINDITYYYI